MHSSDRSHLLRALCDPPAQSWVVLLSVRRQMESRPLARLWGFLYTIWLFTLSDMKTFVFPQTVFGILSALAGPLLTTNHTPSLELILKRVPLVLLWTWLNTLVFDLANQRRPESVLEDKLNKAWRPLPAGRISEDQTRRLLFVAIPLTLALIHFCIRATEETAILFCLTWMYNDLGGSDDSFIVRNLVIAVAYTFYGSGALRVACQPPQCELNDNATSWLFIIGCIIFTTMHVQDLKDMAGDRARDRKTAPLVIGETCTRYCIAATILFWSVVCPWYWQTGLGLWAALVSFGLLVASRAVLLRYQAADVTTWKLWSYWLVSVYALPGVKHLVESQTSVLA